MPGLDQGLSRLRARAAAGERARLARELHDGIIQAVLGVQTQLAALSLQMVGQSPDLASELGRLGTILRQEVVSLRSLIQHGKAAEFPHERLIDALAEMVERFEHETGIAARFISKVDHVALAPRACHEVTRIVQEALVNVRKHSGARNVVVRFASVDGSCVILIEDDGRGFPFAGRLSQDDLEETHAGPWVIKERVRLLGGELTVDSDPGQGTRLEIAVPLSNHAIHG
jgi:signal transduction histidine kinase